MNIEPSQLTSVSKIISPTWLVTADSEQPLLVEHSIVIDGQIIVDILPTQAVANQYIAEQTISLAGQALIPGMINLHSHVPMALMRGFADDLPLMTWLNDYVWPAEAALLNHDFVKQASLLSCAEMLQGGVTTFNDMYFYPLATAEAVKKTGIRANLGLVVIEFPSTYADDADDYLSKGFEAHDSWRDHERITTSLAPHAPYTVSNQTFEKIVTFAEQLDLSIHTHLHETIAEIDDSVNQYGVRPLARLLELGVLSPRLIAAHTVHLDDKERELLAQYGCHIAHCPASNAKLGSGVAEIASANDASINIGLGTDGAASNNRTDLFAEMRLAAMLAKANTQNAQVLSAQQVIEMATINGANALGLGGEIGSINIGKQADLVAVNVSDLSIAPCYDPIAHLVYACGREQVTNTWVAGELRYSDGCFSDIELDELAAIVQRWQPKISELRSKS